MNAFASMPTRNLVRLRNQVADRCVAVMEMPEAERRAAGPKGEASPEEAGAMSAALVMQMTRELQRRGLE